MVELNHNETFGYFMYYETFWTSKIYIQIFKFKYSNFIFKFFKLTKVSEIKNKNRKNVENLKFRGRLLGKQAVKNNIQLVIEISTNKFQLHIIKEKNPLLSPIDVNLEHQMFEALNNTDFQ